MKLRKLSKAYLNGDSSCTLLYAQILTLNCQCDLVIYLTIYRFMSHTDSVPVNCRKS